MKELHEIPECKKLFDEMFKKWAEIPKKTGGKDLSYEKQKQEIEKEYLAKIFEVAKKYQSEHPEEN